jgi:hypothetical protein
MLKLNEYSLGKTYQEKIEQELKRLQEYNMDFVKEFND